MHGTRAVGYCMQSWRAPFSLDFGFISLAEVVACVWCRKVSTELTQTSVYSHLPSSANPVLGENILKV